MMRAFLVSLLALSASAFAPTPLQHRAETALAMERRDVLIAGLTGLATLPAIANANPASTWFYDERIEDVREANQMRTDGRLDINSAFVGDYKELVGMYPTAAGKIASHGPYTSVSQLLFFSWTGLAES
jgi:photosystem II PsbU protein